MPTRKIVKICKNTVINKNNQEFMEIFDIERIYKVIHKKGRINFSKKRELFYHQPKASKAHTANSFQISQFLPSPC